MKAPDSSHEPECACTRSAEQSIFMNSDVCVSRHVRLLRNSQDEREIHIILAVFIMKVPDSSHEPECAGTLAHAGSWILDGQAGMSKQGDSPDYEYRRQMRECAARSI